MTRKAQFFTFLMINILAAPIFVWSEPLENVPENISADFSVEDVNRGKVEPGDQLIFTIRAKSTSNNQILLFDFKLAEGLGSMSIKEWSCGGQFLVTRFDEVKIMFNSSTCRTGDDKHYLSWSVRVTDSAKRTQVINQNLTLAQILDENRPDEVSSVDKQTISITIGGRVR